MERCKGTSFLVAGAPASVVEPTSFETEVSPECRFDLGVRRLYQAPVNQNWGIRFARWCDGARLN